MSKEKQTETATESKITRRSMLKWTAGLAVAGAVGIGLGYGASELLAPVAPVPGAVTKTETVATTVVSTVTPTTQVEEQAFTSCTAAGPVIVRVRDGRIVSLEPVQIPEDLKGWEIKVGDKVFAPPRKPTVSTWSIGSRRDVYSPTRIRYPMKRVGWEPGGKGTVENRGLGEFVRISWDEALDLVASEMKRIKETYGNSAFFLAPTAHKLGPGALQGMGASQALTRFFNMYGGSTQAMMEPISWTGYPYGAGNIWGYYWNLGCCEQNDLLEDTLKNSELVIYWSLDPTNTAQLYYAYDSEVWRGWLKDLGKKQIFIDPVYNDTAGRHADNWIPIKPAQDTALAAAIAYVWITEGTYEKDYVKTHATGFDKWADYITGKQDGVPKTPEWAEKLCGVPARTTRVLAREWGSKPTSLMCQFGGACRGWQATEWTRMMATLQIMQGLGKPGVNVWNFGCWGGAPALSQDKFKVIPGYGAPAWAFVSKSGFKAFMDPIPQYIHVLNFADAILKPPVEWKGGSFMNTPMPPGSPPGSSQTLAFVDHVYPMPGMSEIKMIYQMGAGFLRWVDPNSRVKAFMSPKIETFLVQAPWFEEAARYADILLPAATNFERMDVSEYGVFWGWYLGSVNWRIAIYNKKAIEPVFESKDDLEIFYELAKRVGIYDEFTEGNTQEDWLKKLYALSSYPDSVSYEDFKAKGFAMVNFPADYTPSYALRWYHDKPEGEGLDTADGKFDIYAPYLAKQYGDNDPEVSPIPKYYPPKDQALASKYPLRLIAPHPRRRYHQMHNNSWAKELSKIKIRGYDYEPMWINPVDAKALGIKNEDIVKVTSKTGAILAAAFMTERILPGVVRIDYGTDWDPDDPRNPWLDRAGSTNVLLDNEPISKHCYGEHLAHGMVQVQKWSG